MPIAPASTKNWEVLTMPDITDLAMSFVAMITNSSANASSDTYLWFERSYPLEENVQDLARENKVRRSKERSDFIHDSNRIIPPSYMTNNPSHARALPLVHRR